MRERNIKTKLFVVATAFLIGFLITPKEAMAQTQEVCLTKTITGNELPTPMCFIPESLVTQNGANMPGWEFGTWTNLKGEKFLGWKPVAPIPVSPPPPVWVP